MNTIYPAYGRTPTLLQWQHASLSLGRNNSQLAEVQMQLASGRGLMRPSDDALGAGAVSTLDGLLEAQLQRGRNLSQGEAMLGVIDGSLSEVLNLLLEAKGIGLDQSSSGVDPAVREAQAQTIDSILNRVFGLGNTSHQGVHLFGGSATARSPYVDIDGMIQYLGQGSGLLTDLGLASGVPVTVGGEDVFGAVSTRVEGHRDLDPSLDPGTYLNELNGATGEGVRLGVVEILRDPPGTTVEVDLSEAWTIQDVMDIFQETAGIDISIGANGRGLFITVPDGERISISDPSGGRTAADLGIDTIFTNLAEIGADLDRQLTDNTPISALAFDLGVIRLSNGLKTVDLDLSTAQNISDVRDLVQQLDMGIEIQLNENGDRLDAVNLRSGSLMSVGEVTGDLTATNLGIRSMDRETLLSDFNRGLGVGILSGNIDPETGALDPSLDVDFAVTLFNGERFEVDLAGCITVGDMLDRIREAADNGLADPAAFEVGLAVEGNGIRLEDLSAGGENFTLESLNGSDVLWDLGLPVDSNGGLGATIVSEDRAMVAVEGVFTHLIDLRDALMADDVAGIGVAVERLEGDLERLDRIYADVGIRSRRLSDAVSRNEDMMIMDQQLRSRILDLDYTEASIRFATLQQQLQAGLATSARTVSMTLLNYL